MPIVYASDAFLKLTGYDRHEVLGCNWRFLSGVGTDSSVLNQIQESIQVEQACTVCFLNYRREYILESSSHVTSSQCYRQGTSTWTIQPIYY
ncbi:PROTEIN TWIN LOV 1, partial [Salix purpurea]